jgi:tetratricopeptide (TPR) repeat protein
LWVDGLLANVLAAAPPPLADRAPGVPPDLVTIIEKAMARQPEARYANAAELASDLKRFQGGQLVGAHRYTARELLRRWMRRHRTAVVVATVGVVALAALGALSFHRIVQRERDAQDARQLAEVHRGDAEQNHARAEELLAFMLTDLRDRLATIGRLDVLEAVAERARDYYRTQRRVLAPEEEHRRALALHDLGEVLAAKGDAEAALAEHAAALAIHHALASHDARWRGDLAVSHGLVGGALRAVGKSDEAATAYGTAAVTSEQLVAALPADAGPAVRRVALSRLAVAYDNRADHAYETARDVTSALRDRKAALALREQIVALPGATAGEERALVTARSAVADMMMHAGDLPGSLTAHQRALADVTSLAAREPADSLTQALLADQHELVGGVLHNGGDLPVALEHYGKALAIRQQLAAGDPQNLAVLGLVARAHMNIGQASDELANRDGALEHHRAALTTFERLAAADPANVRARSAVAFSQRLVGSVLLRQRKVSDAVAMLEQSRSAAEALARAEPTNEARKRDVAFVYADLADALAERREHAAALALRHEVLAIVEPIFERDRDNASARIDVIDALGRLGETHERAGQRADAVRALERAIVLIDASPADAPHRAEMLADFRATLARVARRR